MLKFIDMKYPDSVNTLIFYKLLIFPDIFEKFSTNEYKKY